MSYIGTNLVISGVGNDGGADALKATGEGHLEVAIHDPILPFGALHVERMTPVFQIDGVYGINPNETRSTTSGSGSVTAATNLITCATGTTVASVASLQSRRRIRYRPGQGIVARFTAIWSTPVASSVVVAGIGTGESGIFFGYNGTSFGVLHSTGGVREIQTLTVTTASTATNNYVVTLNDVAFNVTATNNGSTARTAYEISRGTYAGWTAEAVGSTVVFLANDVGNKSGAFSLAQTGAGTPAAGSFAETLAGAAATDTWVAQTAWNGDKLDGTGPSGVTLDKAKLNVFQINMQYLGAGTISMQVEVVPTNGNNATFVTVHTFRFPNTRTTPTLSQPSMPFTMAAYSAGSTTNVSVSTASFAGFIEGDITPTGPRQTYFDTSTSVSTGSYFSLMTIRNNLTYGGRANQSVVRLMSFGGACEDTTPVTLFLIKDATLVGTPAFAQHATGSCTYTDTAATTCTITSNNQILFSLPLGAGTGGVFAFTDTVLLQPGEQVTIAAQTVTGTASYVTASLNVREDQ